MFRTKTFVLFALALFLCSAAAMADEEQENGKTTLRTLVVDGVTGAADGVATGVTYAYRGTRYGLKEGVCDGTRAGLNGLRDGFNWAVHQTPAEYGRLTWRGSTWTYDQARKTPGRVGRAVKWGLGHLW